MVNLTNQILKLDIPGDLPISLEAHYDIKVDSGRFGPVCTVDLGYVDWTLAGKSMYCLEGKEIPQAMRDRILAAINLAEVDAAEALGEEAERRAFEREHAAGVL